MPSSWTAFVFFMGSACSPLEQEKGEGSEGKCHDAGHLGAFEETENELGVIPPEVFQKKAGGRVEHDVEGKALSFRVIPAAEHEQEGEDHDVQLSFPYFGGPEWLIAIGMIGEGGGGVEDAEGRSRGRTEGIAVQEISTSPQGLSKDDGGGEDVAQRPGVEAMMLGIEKAGGNTEEDASLDGHAPLPDIEDFREMVGVIIPVEEEDIPEPGTEKTCNAAVDADVHDVFFIPASILLGEEIADTGGEDDAHGEYEAVSADGEVTDEEEILMHGKCNPFMEAPFAFSS